MLMRKRVLAAAIETTVGTAETLDAGDAAFNIYNAAFVPNIAMQLREGQGGFGMLSSVPEGYGGTLTFRTYLEWDGTATEPSWADTFFPACGWVKTGQVYSPTTEAPGSNVKTLTMGLYVDGTRILLSGCMGSFVVTLPTGKPAYIDWTFMGVYGGRTDVAILTPTYPTDKPLRFAGGLAELNNVNLCISQATINSGNTVIMRPCPAAINETGFISALVTNRVSTVTLDPEAVTVAAQDRWGAFIAGTEWALELDVGGPTNSQIEFNAPKAQVINNSETDREGQVVDSLELQCNKNGSTPDQELTITFTAAT
jgi:hypothetical protein